MEDIEIVRFLQQGDERPLKGLMMKYQKILYQFARNRFSFDEPTVEDLYVDSIVAFYKAVKNGKFTIQGEKSIQAFLQRVFHNKLINEFKKRKRRQELQPDVFKSSQNWHLNKEADEEVIRAQEAKILKEAMAELTPRCQKALTLRYFEEMSLKEIAEQMDFKNESTAKSTRYQCYQRLVEIIKKKFRKEDF